MSAVREIILREHQSVSEDAIRAGFRDKKRRMLLVAPTGYGKTEVGANIIQQSKAKGKRAWFIVDRDKLVDQTSKRFASYGIDHGVIQADHPLTDYAKPVQIVSAQTLARRQIRIRPDLIVWDECHAYWKAVAELIENCPEAFAIGLSATPFRPGMAREWDGFVNGATVNYLISKSYLTPLRVKACIAPDMREAQRNADGEYELEDAGSRGLRIIGDVVSTWVEQTHLHFGGPAKTLVFSPSVKHGEELCRLFAEAGYNFQQISYHDSDTEKAEKFREFERPDSAIHGLVSCAVLTKGFDQSDIRIGISCRPYSKSFSSHIQEMGRIMRVHEGQPYGLWLCHSGNAVAFAHDTAHLYEYGVESLSDAASKDSVVREPTEKVKRELFCGSCAEQMPPKTTCCPACGWERPSRMEYRIEPSEELRDISLAASSFMHPRAGLRAACLGNPKAMWNACLAYCFTHGSVRKTEADHRKWAMGIFKGMYPTGRLPAGAYDHRPDFGAVTNQEMDLIGRETRKFRKKAGGKPAPTMKQKQEAMFA